MAKKIEKIRLPGQKPAMNPVNNSGQLYGHKIYEWAGLNLKNTIDTGELTWTNNMTTSDYPALMTRPQRDDTIVAGDIEYPGGVFAVEDALFWISRNRLYTIGKGGPYNLDSYIANGTPRCFVLFNDMVLIFPDCKCFYVKDSSLYIEDINCPDIDYATVYGNRVFGVKGNEIYGTCLGDYNDWDTLSTPLVETDSWATEVASEGEFTGIAAFDNHVVYFKPKYMHEQFGVKPPFRLQDLYKVGTVDHRTIREINNKLYFADDKYVYEYAGGLPRPISLNVITQKMTDAVAGSDGRKYYISYKTGVGFSYYDLLVYDTFTGLWMREDDLRVFDFTYYKGKLYAIADNRGSGTKYNMIAFDKVSEAGESIDWLVETDYITLKSLGAKYVNGIRLRLDHPYAYDFEMKISIAYDRDLTYKSIYDSNYNTFPQAGRINCPVVPRHADGFVIQISGTGHVVLHQMEILTVIGGVFTPVVETAPAT